MWRSPYIRRSSPLRVITTILAKWATEDKADRLARPSGTTHNGAHPAAPGVHAGTFGPSERRSVDANNGTRVSFTSAFRQSEARVSARRRGDHRRRRVAVMWERLQRGRGERNRARGGPWAVRARAGGLRSAGGRCCSARHEPRSRSGTRLGRRWKGNTASGSRRVANSGDPPGRRR